jgi:hypothetical protein
MNMLIIGYELNNDIGLIAHHNNNKSVAYKAMTSIESLVVHAIWEMQGMSLALKIKMVIIL